MELSNDLSEQMMRSVKMNLKNAGNIGGEVPARHNEFMFSVIEGCKMWEECGGGNYLSALLDKLHKAGEGEDLMPLLPCYLSR